MRLRALLVPLVAAQILAVTARPARAAGPLDLAPAAVSASHAAGAPAPPEQVAPDSPRASVQRFLDLCRLGELADAASYLDVSEAQRHNGPELARKLKAVLDRRAWGNVDSVSPLPLGDVGAHLPAGVDQIGTIPGPSGAEPVRLVRRPAPEGTRWVFSRATVERIDGWYDRLPDHWQERIPPALLATGPRDIRFWQWIALPILFLLALGAGKVLGFVTRIVLVRVARLTSHRWDEALFTRLTAPLTVVWTIAAVELSLPSLSLYPSAGAVIDRIMHAGLFASLVWFATRSVDVVSGRILELPAARTNPAARSLVPLGARSLQVVLVVFAFLAGLSELGVAVGSLVAGLGIGGVAIALAAQKTVENLFGSLSIGVDQPFRVGDYVKVDSLSGTVESIGLRSTRVRTLDRTLVTLPNGKLADQSIESYAGRDRMKLGFTLPLVQSTTPAQLREVLAAIRQMLEHHDKIWPDVSVSLARVTETSIEIEVLAWFQTTQPTEFLALREDVLLSILERIHAAGTTLVGGAATPPAGSPAA